jgi:hypothetical protein
MAERAVIAGSETPGAGRDENLAPQLRMMIATFLHLPGRNKLLSRWRNLRRGGADRLPPDQAQCLEQAVL